MVCEARTAYPSGAPEFTPFLVEFVLLDLQFSVHCFGDRCLSICPFLPLCCLSFELRLLITPLVSSSFSAIGPRVLKGLRFSCSINDILTCLSLSLFTTVLKPVPGFPTSYVVVSLLCSKSSVRGDCSLCCYWWNCQPSLFKISFHNDNACPNSWILLQISYSYNDLFIVDYFRLERASFGRAH